MEFEECRANLWLEPHLEQLTSTSFAPVDLSNCLLLGTTSNGMKVNGESLPASISKSAGVWMSVPGPLPSPLVDKVLWRVGYERRPLALLCA